VIISTGAASGKSLGYLLPALSAVLAGETVLYVTPTKALAADQLASIRALGLPGVQAATFDGDTPRAERDWARSHARYLLTTPDMLHQSLLPRHTRWSGFLSRLRYVVIDECHEYRGVFGSHVGHVLRRLRRVVAHHAPPAGRPAGCPAPGSLPPERVPPERVPPEPVPPEPVLPEPVLPECGPPECGQ
jgi:DEAD/DEAH box helicase domain-containing protein